MKLYEYQAREIFKKYGIPVPPGDIAENPKRVREIAEQIGKPVVIKAQVLVAGRGKAGGIIVAETPEDAEKISEKLIDSSIKGCLVKKVLVVEKINILKEIYTRIVIPKAVYEEVAISGKGKKGSLEITKAEWIIVKEVRDEKLKKFL